MTSEEEKSKIRAILDVYVAAFEAADADQMGSLFWIDDPRFSEVENHIAEPFGAKRYYAILDWIREYQEPGWKMRFYDTSIHFLSPEIAYSVSMREMDKDGEVQTSRVSLVYLKREGAWRIIHGHFSLVPES